MGPRPGRAVFLAPARPCPSRSEDSEEAAEALGEQLRPGGPQDLGERGRGLGSDPPAAVVQRLPGVAAEVRLAQVVERPLERPDGPCRGARRAGEGLFECILEADDLAALADFLADKPYFLGDRPTTLDATTYGFLANVLLVTLDTPQKAAARTHAKLCQYVARMTERYFPDG